MTDPKQLAQEITQRRLLISGSRFTVRDAMAEVYYLRHFGIIPVLDNLTRQMALQVEDGEMRQVLLMPIRGEVEIDEKYLDEGADVVAFLEVGDGKIGGGFTSVSQVQEAPLEGGCRHLSREALIRHPREFNFRTGCPDTPCTSSAVWDTERGGWLCFGCDRLRYDSKFNRKYGIVDGEALEYPVALGVDNADR